jgi:hypothetical protein
LKKKDQPYEKDFQKMVLKRLRTIPYSYWAKINDRTTIGLPDVWGCVAGQFVVIELKSRSKLTAIQKRTMNKIRRASGVSIQMTPENFEYTLNQVHCIQETMMRTFRPLR